MQRKTALIIDDEEASRFLIREYLADFPEIAVSGECRNGAEAIRDINAIQPDLVFLDIQMPAINGFQVLQEITHIPLIVFTTAYDQFAIRAFELNALDYLLKPYTRERFSLAMERVRRNAQGQNLHFLAETNTINYPSRILVEKGNRLKNIAVDDILYLKAEKDYTQIHTEGQSYLSSQGIGTLEKRLDPEKFIRIHRSHIVNILHVKEAYRDISKMFVVMQNDTELSIGRNYTENLRKLIY
jgi:two-component system LytT family response regulator